MRRKLAYQVTLRHSQTGEQQERTIIADDAPMAQKRAVERARVGTGKTMAQRIYDQYEVVSCKAQDRS